ncbi:hypothetical protein [Streptomyces coeruleorubidus]|uniref:hypothetical protein n=1 Tax=Streptomyces coeruleorubidus TaxID=116188 RepID=UPI003653C968
MSATESKGQPLPFAVAGVSMRDLLAAGEAAALISTPPRAPEPGFADPVKQVKPAADHREAA